MNINALTLSMLRTGTTLPPSVLGTGGIPGVSVDAVFQATAEHLAQGPYLF